MTAQLVDRAVITKGEFAARCSVHPSRVSQWIKEGKLSGAALEGEGRSAQIRVEVALSQLDRRLDPSQRFGLNGARTTIAAAASAGGPAASAASVQPTAPARPTASAALPFGAEARTPAASTVDDQIRREHLRKLELDNRDRARRDRAAEGVYVLAAEVGRQMNAIAQSMVAAFDGMLPELANAVAKEFGLAQRDVTHVLRSALRTARTRASQAQKARAQTLPAQVDDAGGDARISRSSDRYDHDAGDRNAGADRFRRNKASVADADPEDFDDSDPDDVDLDPDDTDPDTASEPA